MDVKTRRRICVKNFRMCADVSFHSDGLNRWPRLGVRFPASFVPRKSAFPVLRKFRVSAGQSPPDAPAARQQNISLHSCFWRAPYRIPWECRSARINRRSFSFFPFRIFDNRSLLYLPDCAHLSPDKIYRCRNVRICPYSIVLSPMIKIYIVLKKITRYHKRADVFYLLHIVSFLPA